MISGFKHQGNWAEAYQRNNKGGGLKNLRCFPHCKSQHVERGYCGAPVLLELKEKALHLVSKRLLLAVAAFRPVELISELDSPSKDPNVASLETSQKFVVGSKVDVNQLLRYQKMQSKPRQLFFGEFHGDEIEFNALNKGWNYSWHGTKHTSKTKHCLTVYLFKREDGVATCIETFDSPRFTVFSRKKRKRNSNESLQGTSQNTEKLMRLADLSPQQPLIQNLPLLQPNLFTFNPLLHLTSVQLQSLSLLESLKAMPASILTEQVKNFGLIDPKLFSSTKL